MIVIFVITLGATLLVQFWLRSTYAKWQKVPSTSALTGAEAARAILNANGLHDVRVEAVKGALSDHYDPRERVVRLSEDNYFKATVAGTAVAAHEVGHAIQHASAYKPLEWRAALVPVASIGANFGPWIIIAGALMGAMGLIQIGLVFFAAAVVFQLVTLPVEFDASRRAMQQMNNLGLATSQDISGSRQVLNAAAMTYVAAAASSVAYLLYYLSMFLGND